jgi:hypothetical protein
MSGLTRLNEKGLELPTNFVGIFYLQFWVLFVKLTVIIFHEFSFMKYISYLKLCQDLFLLVDSVVISTDQVLRLRSLMGWI